MVQMPNGSILLQVTEIVDCLINSSKKFESVDIIDGKIADDQTARTL